MGGSAQSGDATLVGGQRDAARSLSEILDLTVLVSNNHGVTGIDNRYVEGTVVLALEQKLCLFL
jgi:hypothetical protein